MKILSKKQLISLFISLKFSKKTNFYYSMRLSQLFIMLLGLLICYSMKITTSARTTRQTMDFYCESTIGPKSPHDACITFDSDKYHLCKGSLIC